MMQAQSGFTLIELMIVTAVVGVLAGVAVPNLTSARTVANERAVAATLRTIATAQAQCCSQQVVDGDGDGRGEALGLGELAGTQPLRTSAVRLVPPGLAQSLGTLDANGYATSKGYLLALYLPDASGTGLIASPTNGSSIDADQAEVSWTCVAWPASRGRSGNTTFFVNQSGEILVSRTATYNGQSSVPPAGAALVGVPPTTIVGGELASDAVGADGNTWSTLK